MPTGDTPELRIAKRIKAARLAAGISQREAGRRLKITERNYARWERGETKGWTGHLAEVAKALETKPEVLLGGESINPPRVTVEALSSKLDQVLVELAQVREQLNGRPRTRGRP